MNKKILTFSIRGELKTMCLPAVMGVINITPDSFYSKSRTVDEKDILEKAGMMVEDKADILDIGAVSTRPGADLIDEKEELTRLIPPLNKIRKYFPNTFISVDTFRSVVAIAAANEGADIINDISAGMMDEKMLETVADLRLPYILMHIQGTPKDMQKNPKYIDVIKEINYFFAQQIQKVQNTGIHDIIIDPGFGFGKTIKHNFQILDRLQLLKIHNKTLLVGLSRKSMIYHTLNTTPLEALTGTIALNTVALLKGADILRVHDVKEAKETIKVIKNLKNINISDDR